MVSRVFKTRPFGRWMRKLRLSDAALRDAVSEMAQGLIDADLGGHLMKKRIPLHGRGKRGGARVLVATEFEDRWFFLYGFDKTERANIDKDELRFLQEMAKELLALDDRRIMVALASGVIAEVRYGSEKQ